MFIVHSDLIVHCAHEDETGTKISAVHQLRRTEKSLAMP